MVMKPRSLFRHWLRGRQRLLSGLRTLIRQCRRRGDAEQIHELRVTLRRLRLFVRVGRPLLDPHVAASFRAWAHEISKLTSPVRDLDVAIEWLRKEQNSSAASEACQQARDQLWRTSRHRLRPPPPGLLNAMGKIADTDTAPASLARRARKLKRRYEAAARDALPRFSGLRAADQHEFRRTLRWWRYLRELGLRRKRQARDALLAALIAAQETTGDRQNLALTMTALRRHWSGPQSAPLRGQLRREQAEQMVRIKNSLEGLARRRKWLSPA